jgi:DNA-binding GntR family transcriptional regulator
VGSSNRDKIPDEVLKGIFPKKLEGRQARSKLYDQLRQMILSGKLRKGQRLSYEEIVQDFNVSRGASFRVISQLKGEGLIIWQGKQSSFVTQLFKIF